jgi:lipopolysaccharide biosynthesis glycosyltransferase
VTSKPLNIFLGFDIREGLAFEIARQSIRRFDRHLPIHALVLSRLQLDGIYTRPTEWRLGKLWDAISEHHMATEFALSRFLVPHLMERMGLMGWGLFMDCDVMVRANLQALRNELDDRYAVMCVKHEHNPTSDRKMDEQVQSAYGRKNWSSVMAFNCGHPANRALTLDEVNNRRGLWLHQMSWLGDEDIGALGPEWNYLVGHTRLPGTDKAKIVHFTDGGPWFGPQFANVEYAEEWRHIMEQWAMGSTGGNVRSATEFAPMRISQTNGAHP